MKLQTVSLRTLMLAPIVATMILLIGFLTYYASAAITRYEALEQRIETALVLQSTLLKITEDRARLKEMMNNMMNSVDPEKVAAMKLLDAKHFELIDVVKDNIHVIGPSQTLLQSYLESNNMQRKLRDQIVVDSLEQNYGRARKLFDSYSYFYRINSSKISDLNALMHLRIESAKAELSEFLRSLSQMLPILILIAITTLAVFVYLYQSFVLKPVLRLRAAFKRVRSGNLSIRVEAYDAPAEIHSILSDFNSMTETLERMKTQLTEAREDALAAAKTKSEFLANMSHEIRTPLNAIVGISDLLSESVQDRENSERIKILQSSSDLLLNVVNDVLDFSKLEAGKISLVEEPFNLHQSIEKIQSVMNVIAHEKNISLVTFISSDVPAEIVGDQNRVEQVLLNLVSNAVKFTSVGGVKISVSIADGKAGSCVKIEVEDSGIGIPADQQHNLFQRFEQVELQGAQKKRGTGLGLAIVRQLARLMNGQVELESSSENGSVFVFQFPLVVTEAGKVQAPLPAAPIQDLTVPRSILLVDDSPENRFLVRAYLKGTVQDIFEASNGAEAVEIFAKRKFDVVLMDIQMPIMDGHAATAAIREYEKASGVARTKIIALTAYAFEEEMKKCLESGCDSHLAKPIRKADLLRALGATPAPSRELFAH